VIEWKKRRRPVDGAVLNMRPDLFHAALVGVPFVDVMNTMLDDPFLLPSANRGVGNPKQKPLSIT